MSTFQTLTEAFAELERRADAASADHADEPLPVTPVRRRSHLLLVAASIVTVLVIATGAVLMARGHARGPDRISRSQGAAPAATGTAPSARTPFRIPRTSDELVRRFRAVLGGTATFTVTQTDGDRRGQVTIETPSGTVVRNLPFPSTQPSGAGIVGLVTADGVTGGFDLQVDRDRPGAKAWCDDAETSHCTVRRLGDGSSLAVGHEPLQGSANGVTYQVNLIRADGVEFIMHVSNERSPKGESPVLAAHPPLTIARMSAIVTSDRW